MCDFSRHCLLKTSIFHRNSHKTTITFFLDHLKLPARGHFNSKFYGEQLCRTSLSLETSFRGLKMRFFLPNPETWHKMNQTSKFSVYGEINPISLSNGLFSWSYIVILKTVLRSRLPTHNSELCANKANLGGVKKPRCFQILCSNFFST